MAMPFASLSPAADHRPSATSFPPFCRASPPSPPLSAVGEDAQQQQQNAMSGRWAAAPPFTPAQYEELERQALIYKYLLAGVPIPQDLLLPIRRGYAYHQPALGYGPYFGKKVDLEPGRCRRTDGKKWRCSKEAAPDSKYCERHMHRGRNRSRKPVEPQLVAAPLSSQPTQAPGNNLAGVFQNNTLYPAIAGSRGGGGGATGTFGLGSTAQLHMDNAAPYAIAAGCGSKDLRYSTYGMRTLAAEYSQQTSGGMDSSIENSWRLQPSQPTTYQVSSYPLYGTLSGLDESTICSLPKTEREPVSFFGSDLSFANSAKQENQTLRPFFDEWPKSRDSWSELADDNSLSSFSATQLSISIPMGTSDFNTSSRSPHGIQSR